MKPKTFQELQEALDKALAGEYYIGHDNGGQLIVYTGMMQSDNDDILIPFNPDAT